MVTFITLNEQLECIFFNHPPPFSGTGCSARAGPTGSQDQKDLKHFLVQGCPAIVVLAIKSHLLREAGAQNVKQLKEQKGEGGLIGLSSGTASGGVTHRAPVTTVLPGVAGGGRLPGSLSSLLTSH